MSKQSIPDSTAVSMILIPQTTLISLLTYTGFMALIVAANVAFALGLSLLNPAFSEKSANATLMINLMIVVFVSTGMFIGTRVGLGRIFPGLEPSAGILYSQLLLIALSWLVGIMFLYLGRKRLNRIE